MQKKLHLKNRDQTYELGLESRDRQYQCSIKDALGAETKLLANALMQDAHIVLTTAEGRFACTVARDEHGVWISCQGHAEYFEIERKSAKEALQPASESELRAPMTGRVVSVRVQPGQTIQAGDIVVILEAMKMEFRIEAPYASSVREVNCKPGDLVDLGQVLVTIDVSA
jgi:acetyl/propionyl-CoA carboxylase alpha subunit